MALYEHAVTARVLCIVLHWTSLHTLKARVSSVDCNTHTVIPVVSGLIKAMRCVKFYVLSIVEKNALLLSARA